MRALAAKGITAIGLTAALTVTGLAPVNHTIGFFGSALAANANSNGNGNSGSSQFRTN